MHLPPFHAVLRMWTALLAAALGSADTVPTDMAVPDFGRSPTVRSIADGPWSSPSTWSTGAVPGAGDVVEISAGTTVTYDEPSSPAIGVITVDGSLEFSTRVSTSLTVATMVVDMGGFFSVGTTDHPVPQGITASVVFADQAIDTSFDPQQFGTGLIGMGTVRVCGAALSPTWVRVSAEPHAGDTTLSLASAVSGWGAGDTLLLPDTRHLDFNEVNGDYVPEFETLTVAAVSGDGRTITLSAPLAFDHKGAYDARGTLRYLPHVADTARNVVFTSQNPAGTRGHVMFMGRADVDVRYATFLSLGRTTIATLDDTTFDANGNVIHIGTNEEGRYPLHAHHLVGPATPQANGYQYTFIGNALSMRETWGLHKWPITIHDSHYGLVQDNVMWDYAGAGLAGEEGSESGNMISHNFATRAYGDGIRGDLGTAGHGFWFRGANNHIVDNVASDMISGMAFRYGIAIYQAQLGPQTIPVAQGDDPSVPGQGATVDMHGVTLPEFARNEVYGACAEGYELWGIGANYRTPVGTAGTVKDCVCWHQRWVGIYLYETNLLTIDGFTDIGNPANIEGMSIGIYPADYMQQNLTITGADIENEGLGINAPDVAMGTTTIEDGLLVNHADLSDQTMSSANGNDLPPKRLVVRNVRFGKMPTDASETDLILSYLPGGAGDAIQSDTTFFYQFNGDPQDNFQVFYSQQAADFIVPQSVNGTAPNSIIGAPIAGLTNAQTWARFNPDGSAKNDPSAAGMAIAGAIAPADAAPRANFVNCLVEAIQAPPGQPQPPTPGSSTGGATAPAASGGGAHCGLGGGIATLLFVLALARGRRSFAARAAGR